MLIIAPTKQTRRAVAVSWRPTTPIPSANVRKKRLKIKRKTPTAMLALEDAFADAAPELMVLVLVD